MQRKAARNSERHWWAFGDRQEQLMKGVAYALSLSFCCDCAAQRLVYNAECVMLSIILLNGGENGKNGLEYRRYAMLFSCLWSRKLLRDH